MVEVGLKIVPQPHLESLMRSMPAKLQAVVDAGDYPLLILYINYFEH